MVTQNLEESSHMLHNFLFSFSLGVSKWFFCFFNFYAFSYLLTNYSTWWQIPIFALGFICPHIPFLNYILLLSIGPFQIGDWLRVILASLIQFKAGKRFYIAAFRALRNGATNMDVLVAMGTSAAYFYSIYALLYGAITGFWSRTYFETSPMLITFVLFGKYLETLAKGKTSDAIKKLVELAPSTALLLLLDKGT